MQKRRCQTWVGPLYPSWTRSGPHPDRDHSSRRARRSRWRWPRWPGSCLCRTHAAPPPCRWTWSSGRSRGTVWGTSASSPSWCQTADRSAHKPCHLRKDFSRGPTEIQLKMITRDVTMVFKHDGTQTHSGLCFSLRNAAKGDFSCWIWAYRYKSVHYTA